MSKNTLLALALLILLFGAINSALGQSTVQSVTRLEREVKALQIELRRKFNRLSAAKKNRVLGIRSGRTDDSDLDGVPDNLEQTSNRCDSDSDDDGVTDGEEYSNGDDPNDSDSDDDGFIDSLEFEDHRLLEATTDTTLTAGGESYVLDGGTVFRDGAENLVTVDFYAIGDCLELEGHLSGVDKVLDEVKPDDDCGTPGGGGAVPFEILGRLEGKSSSSVTMNSETYLINDSTEFLDDLNSPVTLDFFSVGDCVELDGHTIGSSNILEKIKEEDGCV